MAYVTEAVQKRQEFVGVVTAAVTAVCVRKAAGAVQVGVQLVQHVGAVLHVTTGVIQTTTTHIVVLSVTDVQTAGTDKDMAVTQTETVFIVV